MKVPVTFVIDREVFLNPPTMPSVRPHAPIPAERAVDFNSTHEVVIDRAYKWNPDMSTCPRGCKVQLLGAGGVPSYAIYSGDPFWVKWAPLPSN